MIAHAKNPGVFIALSYILQAAKDILYWKGNASSLQTVLIKQCRPCADIKGSSRCHVTIPDRPNLFYFDRLYWWLMEAINRVFCLIWKASKHISDHLIYLLSPFHRLSQRAITVFGQHGIDFWFPNLVCELFAPNAWFWIPCWGFIPHWKLFIQEVFCLHFHKRFIYLLFKCRKTPSPLSCGCLASWTNSSENEWTLSPVVIWTTVSLTSSQTAWITRVSVLVAALMVL